MALILRVMCYFFLTQVDRHFSCKLEVNLLCHGPKIFATRPGVVITVLMLELITLPSGAEAFGEEPVSIQTHFVEGALV